MRGLAEIVQAVRGDEAARRTVKDFFEKLDGFHDTVQNLGSVGQAGYQLMQYKEAVSAGTTSESDIEVRYFQISLMAFLYGALGLMVFGGVFLFAWCTGKTNEIGWKSIVLENISGSRLPHFFAYLTCFVGGIIGFISANKETSKYLPMVLPVFMLLASILNRTASATKKKNDTSSIDDGSFRAPQVTRRNAIAPVEVEVTSAEDDVPVNPTDTAARRFSTFGNLVNSQKISIEKAPAEQHTAPNDEKKTENNLQLPAFGNRVSSEELDNRDEQIEFTDLQGINANLHT